MEKSLNLQRQTGWATAILILTAISFSGFAYSQSQGLTVATDKASYNAGDAIIVSGAIQQDNTLAVTVLQIVNPNNRVLSTHVPSPDGDGFYSVEVATDDWEISGTYTVRVIHADEERQATFEFAGLDSKTPTENLNVAFSDGTSQSVDAKLTNGVITGITAVEESASLIFSLATGSEDGELTVTLARDLIDSRYEPSEDGIEHENNFLVMVDGDYTDYGEPENDATSRTLVIPIPAGTQEVLIGGSSMTPEFPLAVLGAVVATTIVLALGRVRMFGK